MKRDPAEPEAGTFEAAETLWHDLGKAIRLSAPERLEESADALRERLRGDVLETRRDGSTVRSAADVFERWRRSSAASFAQGDLGRRVDALAVRVDELRTLSAAFDRLDRAALERLDDLTRRIAADCREIVAAARGSRGPR
jgi:hypothetical protein